MPASFRHRLTAEKDPILERHTVRWIESEKELYLDEHLAINRAHATMLAEVGILTDAECRVILDSLARIEHDAVGELVRRGDEEDLFSVIEGALIRICGVDIAGKLHTGRSRNDYYMTLARLVIKRETEALITTISDLVAQLLSSGERYADQVFPGYTHNSQQAQPVSLGHFFLAHADAFTRDLERHRASLGRVDLSPMGAAALGGTDFPLDRHRMAELLGFAGIVENTQDAAGIRDFQLETAGNIVTLMMNADRLVEALVMYATTEFGLIVIDDSLMGVSSIMPQKRNPVALEYVETIASKSLGAFVSAAATLKSTTIGMSEEAISIDDTIVRMCLDARDAVSILTKIIDGVRVDSHRVEEVLRAGFFTVTQLTDFLVAHEGFPFRVAHTVVALAVTHLTAENLDLSTSPGRERFIAMLREEALTETGRVLASDDAALLRTLEPSETVLSRTIEGGPGVERVREMTARRKQSLSAKGALANS
ncbi:argininosuccinate lyase [Leucobacter tenebrionis]|uniref:argininosuccinate lyase n=1 Tax=Leucobacter tenebrionis TaxID=2873270 RepID=UPI001CA64FF4|nr:argininosuccinate lyase [Leucobacter tenebrionis]QZY51611.1 argininosuccinate lyase [Leucobacter tenebrionis]